MNARQVIRALLSEIGEHEGSAGIESVAAKGYAGDLPDESMAVLLDAFGSPGDALYAIQLAAQDVVSANAYAAREVQS